MTAGHIRINWRPPLDPKVYGYGLRVDPGGYIYQVFDGAGRKMNSGSSNTDLDQTTAHARRLAAEKGYPEATLEIVSTAPAH